MFSSSFSALVSTPFLNVGTKQNLVRYAQELLVCILPSTRSDATRGARRAAQATRASQKEPIVLRGAMRWLPVVRRQIL